MSGAQGGIKATPQREFRQIFPQPGWVEHDPKEIWATQLATAREALAKAGLGAGGAESVKSMSISSSRASCTIAGRLNLLWSAATQTWRECPMMALATLTSR